MQNKNSFIGKGILIITIFLLVISIVFSVQDTYRIRNPVNLVIGCVNSSGTMCSTSVGCNMNINYPNSTILLNNTEMTNMGNGIFNYTFTPEQITSTGDYNYIILCNDSYEGWYISSSFLVTQNGLNQSTSQGIGSFAYLVLIVALTFLFGYLGFKFIESEYLWVLGIFFWVLSLLFLIYDVWLGYEYRLGLTGYGEAGIMEYFFYILLAILVSGFFMAIVMCLKNWHKIVDIAKRTMSEKATDSEDEDGWDHNNYDRQE